MASGAGLKSELTEGSYALSPMQQGMLFHALRARESGVDISQVIVDLPEELDAAVFESAWQHLAERHDILRTTFRWEGLEQPLQIVHPKVKIPVAQCDWRGLPESEQTARLEKLLNEERRRGFELTILPLMRVVLIRKEKSQFVWTYHHILIDARSLTVLLR